MKSTADAINARHAGASPEDIANQLLFAVTIGETARILFAASAVHSLNKGFAVAVKVAASQVADEYRGEDFHFNPAKELEPFLPPEQIARALHDEDGLGLPPKQIARLLYEIDEDGLGLEIEELALALYGEKGLNLSSEQVAHILHDQDGLDLNAFTVARAFYHKEGPGLAPEQVALVLYDPDGLNLSVPDVAYTLLHESGPGLSVEEVSLALKEGLVLTPEEVADALDAAKSIQPPEAKSVKF